MNATEIITTALAMFCCLSVGVHSWWARRRIKRDLFDLAVKVHCLVLVSNLTDRQREYVDLCSTDEGRQEWVSKEKKRRDETMEYFKKMCKPRAKTTENAK